VLGNKLRCDIINSLRKEPKTVQKICKEIKAEQSIVSHALKDLRKCSFVNFKQKGKEREYYLSSDIFTKSKNKPLFELLKEHVEKNCKGKY
jgi:DNA-binding transcriptional ArsR family regulator